MNRDNNTDKVESHERIFFFFATKCTFIDRTVISIYFIIFSARRNRRELNNQILANTGNAISS